jgi:hypothetical protein
MFYENKLNNILHDLFMSQIDKEINIFKSEYKKYW